MPAAGLCRSVFTSPLWDSRYWMPDLEKTVDKNRLLSPLLSTGKDHLKARRGQVSCVEGVSFSFVEGVNYPRAPVTLRRGCRKNHVTAPGKAWSANGQAAARAARDRRPLRKRPGNCVRRQPDSWSSASLVSSGEPWIWAQPGAKPADRSAPKSRSCSQGLWPVAL